MTKEQKHHPIVLSGMSESTFATFELERAIALRWTLRDIKAKRFRLLPPNDSDVRTLTELGLVELRDDLPVPLLRPGMMCWPSWDRCLRPHSIRATDGRIRKLPPNPGLGLSVAIPPYVEA